MERLRPPSLSRTKEQRYRLKGEKCESCGEYIFPPRDICPNCRVPARAEIVFSGRGEVWSFTTMYDAPAGFQRYVPYTVALVQLEEGPLITAQLTDVDPGEVKIGMPVEMVTRRIREGGEDGLIQYGYKFRERVGSPEPVR